MVLTGPSDPDMSQQNALAFWAVVPGVNHKAEEVVFLLCSVLTTSRCGFSVPEKGIDTLKKVYWKITKNTGRLEDMISEEKQRELGS